MTNAMKPKPQSAGTGSDLSSLADLAEAHMEQVVPYSGRGLEGDAAREEMQRLSDELGLGLEVVRTPGRPGRDEKRPSTTASRTVRLDDDLDQQLAVFAQREGVSASAVLRAALRTYLDDRA